ncbi:kinase-like domain-containing protein, partial [Amanita rubescens]
VIPESVFVDFRDVQQVESSTFASGRSADVYHGLYHGKRVALRRSRTTGLNLLQDMCRETLIWWTLKHQNVLPCLGVYFTSWPGQLTSVSPFMENGTLWDWRTKAMRFAGDIERLILGVAEGLQYLHDEGVIHGDLHGDNVLLDSNGQPKISDYGLARHSDSVHTGISGLAYAFAAPELIQDDDSFAIRTEKTDIFSFGRLYYQIHYGRRPFDGKGQYSISHKVKKGIRPKKMAEPILSDRAWVLMSQCWQTNPTRRPTMSIIVKTMQSWPWPLA